MSDITDPLASILTEEKVHGQDARTHPEHGWIQDVAMKVSTPGRFRYTHVRLYEMPDIKTGTMQITLAVFYEIAGFLGTHHTAFTHLFINLDEGTPKQRRASFAVDLGHIMANTLTSLGPDTMTTASDLLLDPVLARLVELEPRRAHALINTSTVRDDPIDEEATDTVMRGMHGRHPGRVVAMLSCDIGTATWDAAQRCIVVEDDIPETVLSTLAGADLTRLVEHPLIPEGIVITGESERTSSATIVHVEWTARHRLHVDADAGRIHMLPLTEDPQ